MAENTARRYKGERSQEWKTPDDLYAALEAEFHFTLDPCQSGRTDGLARSWRGHRVYCNPPYHHIEPWLAKRHEADCVVYLLPSRTGAGWWADALTANEIRFIRGRLRFSASGSNAPEWSVVLIYRSS